MREVFGAIVGNRELRNRLANDILSDSLPHACILEGPTGTGKHTVVRMIAAALACEQKKNERLPLPCLSCPSCKKVLEGKSPDLITVGCDGKATIGVDTVRFLREDVRVVPNDGEHKVYLVEDADKMTPQAQNALLLTLEEPPRYVHFFLLCKNAGLLLETIRSRAPILRTEPIETREIDRYLCEHDRRASQMKLTDAHGYAELLMSASNGIGRALAFLDPQAFAPIRQLRALTAEFAEAAVSAKGARVMLPLLSRFSSKREILQEQLSSLSDALRDLILLKKSEDAPLAFYADRVGAIELCDRTSLGFLYRLLEAVLRALDENARNANVRLLLIKMAQSAELI